MNGTASARGGRRRRARDASAQARAERLKRLGGGTDGDGDGDGGDAIIPGGRSPGRARRDPLAEPPPPPLELTPLVACDPATDRETLEYLVREAPELRRWVVANPAADARLLEEISQAGGPGVREALTVLLDSLEGRAD